MLGFPDFLLNSKEENSQIVFPRVSPLKGRFSWNRRVCQDFTRALAKQEGAKGCRGCAVVYGQPLESWNEGGEVCSLESAG